MADYQVLRTDLDTGETSVSYRMMGVTSEDKLKQEIKRLNKLSEKDFTMNFYSYREIAK